MDIIQSIAAFIFALTLLISLHEWGHAFVAKKCGISVQKFSVGFGKALWSHTDKQGTTWAISTWLLGGYVQLLDTREQNIPPEQHHKAFDKQPFYQRALVILAGPIMNFILGFVFVVCHACAAQTKSVSHPVRQSRYASC